MVERAVIEVKIDRARALRELEELGVAPPERRGRPRGAGGRRRTRDQDSPVRRARRVRSDATEPIGIVRQFRQARADALRPLRGGGALRFAGGAFAEEGLVRGTRIAARTLARRFGGSSAMRAAGAVGRAGGALAAAVIAPFIVSEMMRAGAPIFAGIADAMAANPGFLGSLGKALQETGLLQAVLERTEELGAAVRGRVAGHRAVAEVFEDLREIGALRGLTEDQISTLVRSNVRAQEFHAARRLRETAVARQRRVRGLAESLPETVTGWKQFILDTIGDAAGGFTRR